MDRRLPIRLPRAPFAIALLAASPTLVGALLAVTIEGCGPRSARPAHPTSASIAPTLLATSLTASARAIPTSAAPAPEGPTIDVALTGYGLAEERPCDGPHGGSALLLRCDGSTLARVDDQLAREVKMQGSARLCDGRVVNVRRLAPLCFAEVPATMPWGVTSSGRPAIPFRSIAIDPAVLAMGGWYYVAALDGLTLPAPSLGVVHDGCVHAEDTGGAVRGAHIDLFVGPLHGQGIALLAKRVGSRATIARAEARCGAK